jgi:type IV pilus assembly protein PilB
MPEEQHQKRLGEILIKKGIITEAQLNEVLEEQKFTKRFLAETLVARKLVSEEQIAKILSEQLGLAYVDLSGINIERKAVDLIPEEIAVKYTAMPLFVLHDTLTVAMANPLNVNAVDELQSLSGLRVQPVFACVSAIRNAIDKYYHFKEEARVSREPGAQLSPEAGPPLPEPLAEGEVAFMDKQARPPQDSEFTMEQVASLKEAASLSPVVETVNNIITRAVEMSASDIHLEPQRNILNCRYRIDGVLHMMSNIPSNYQAAVISRVKIMASMDIAEKRLPQDGRIRMSTAGRDVDLRISTFPTVHGENLVIRILDRSRGILELEQLGFSKDVVKQFSELIKRPYGIILVTGPTGSGKTTTLYAALNAINNVEKNIITLEDPVEYELTNIRQSQVNVKAGLTFATGLRSIVRQDPDIIMVGEIRDKETADISIHAALTGHLVFSTLHTNDAPSAATRLIDMGVEPFLISSSVIGILAQRLVRILCPYCKKEYTPSKELVLQLGLDSERKNAKTQKRKNVFYKETGCKRCKQRGYIGRTGIYELLIPNERIKELIAQKASAAVLRDEAVKSSGMKTLREAGIEKVVQGVSSVAEVLRVTEEV